MTCLENNFTSHHLSSDLWVATSVPNAKDLGEALTLSYAVGTAAGAFVLCS